MLSFLSSFGASSNFQKHRLILTTKNYQSPDQTSLKKIIQTFRGEDQQTRSQIAFATIIKKIHTSDSSDNWIYLLKNLIIFDRVVQENCFLQQIASLNLKPIQNYTQKIQNAKALNSQNILKTYWKLIQYKSMLLSQGSIQKSINYLNVPSSQDNKNKRQTSYSKVGSSNSQVKFKKSQNKAENDYDSQRSILSVFRSQKLQFLKTLSIQQLYKQSVQLQTLFEYIFKMIASIENENKSKVKKKRSGGGQGYKSFKQSNIKREGSSKISLRKQESSPLYEKLLSGTVQLITQQNYIQNQKFRKIRQQFFSSKVVGYLHLQLLYKLLSAYSNQLICIKMLTSHLMQQTSINNGYSSSKNNKLIKINQNQLISQNDINLWKKIIINYLGYSQKIITYVERHKGTKGFELINYQELSPFQNINILSILDEYINHKNTLQQPDIVKVEQLGTVISVKNQIKVQRKAQWSYQKSLTARKLVFPARDLKNTNTAFHNWHNSYSSNFPPKQILTLDLLMQMRSNLTNNQSHDVDDDQSIYQPFLVNRHSCIYNFRVSNISNVSQFQFIPLNQMKKKDQEKLKQSKLLSQKNIEEEDKLQSQISKKTKSFYYFKFSQGEKPFRNIYSSLQKNDKGSTWVR